MTPKDIKVGEKLLILCNANGHIFIDEVLSISDDIIGYNTKNITKDLEQEFEETTTTHYLKYFREEARTLIGYIQIINSP